MMLAGLFLRALLDPLQHADFIFRTGPWLFVVEFISFFAIDFSLRQLSKIRVFSAILEGGLAILFFGGFALLFGFFILQDFTIPLIFFGSIIAKAFGSKAAAEDLLVRKTAYCVLLITSALFILVLIPELLIKTFPFPEEVFRAQTSWEEKMGYRVSGSSGGEFVERPQTLLGWGVIYYFFAATVEIGLFLRARKNMLPN